MASLTFLRPRLSPFEGLLSNLRFDSAYPTFQSRTISALLQDGVDYQFTETAYLTFLRSFISLSMKGKAAN